MVEPGAATFRVVAIIDTDDFVTSARIRGDHWARAQLTTATAIVEGVVGSTERASWQHVPPDEWVLRFAGEQRQRLYNRALACARLIHARIGAETEMTASVGLCLPRRGTQALLSAESQARRSVAAKLVHGGDQVIEERADTTIQHAAPALSRELVHSVQSRDRSEITRVLARWIQRCADEPGVTADQLRAWAAGLLIDVAEILSPRQTGAGAVGWLGRSGGIGLADLVEISLIHERSYLLWWVDQALDRVIEERPLVSGEVLVRRAEDFLAHRFRDSDLSLGEVGRQLAVSPYHLAHLFRRFRDTTFLTYLTGLRLRWARQLLITSALPVSDVAAQCGYATGRQFRLVFKREIGCTPTEYRCRHHVSPQSVQGPPPHRADAGMI